MTVNSDAKRRLVILAMSILLLTSAYQRIHTASVMEDTAKAFLASLTPEQRAQATFQFTDEERFDWHYIPKPRKGLPLLEMQPFQKPLAMALLSSGLSQRGFIKATTIMSLEDVLRQLEHDDGKRRDPQKYYFTIFGEPSDHGTWGWRVEGHHISLNFTLVNGKVVSTPDFFGSNPARVLNGPRAGLSPLAREESLGRELITACTPQQRSVAIVDKTAYKDILTTNSRKAALNGHPSGLQISSMNGKEREILNSLIEEYAYSFPEPVALSRMEEVKKSGNNLWFAWAGGEKPGEGHYYRIQSPSFLIEFDDTQDHANHIHSVWREFDGDWGLDLLKEHYQTSHNYPPKS